MPHFLTHESPRQLMLEPGKLEHCVDNCETNALDPLLENCNFFIWLLMQSINFYFFSFFLMASMLCGVLQGWLI